MHDYKSNNLPESFLHTWVENWERANYVLRNNTDYFIPQQQYVYLSNHPLYIFPRLWNNLDPSLKNVESRHIFLENLKKKLLNEI